MLVEVGDRYRAHGDSAAGDRSSAPKHRPTRMPRSAARQGWTAEQQRAEHLRLGQLGLLTVELLT